MSASRTAMVALAVLCLAAVSPSLVVARDGSPAHTGASAPVVQSMVVGIGGRILSPARAVAAAAGTVSVSGRRCALAAGTPLAALAALRGVGGPAFALRDYGRCGASPANSGQLFVYSLGAQSNRGQSGWEYKVDGYAGSTGAGDPSGPRGDGRRLRAGDQLLWFWCAASAGGCQRTLSVAATSTTVARGARFEAAARGLDNEGRAGAVAGAIVTLGSDFASTGANGRATLIAPTTAGSYRLVATRRGLVPSFPETIVVR